MKLLYLDYNCFQRGFDDPTQTRIQMEALACNEIFMRALQSKVTLVWSFMHEDENSLSPFPRYRSEVLNLAALCEVSIAPSDSIRNQAMKFESSNQIDAKDAIHLACALSAKVQVFLTCDDRLIRRARKIKLPFAVMNPVAYVTGESHNETEAASQ